MTRDLIDNPFHDVLVVGGGPAGLTAALHLAWHDRRVVVLDRRTGPLFFTLETLYNVPSMPEVTGVKLLRTLRAQAEGMGAEVVRANVVEASGEVGDFLLRDDRDRSWRGRTVLLATGVARYHPTIDGDFRPCFHYAGKGNLFYCPDCEAPLAQDKPSVVIAVGSADGAAGMALGLTRYSSSMTLVLTGDRELSAPLRRRLAEKEVEVVEGAIEGLVGAAGRKGRLQALELEGGVRVEADAFFVSSPARGRTDLAEQLGVDLAATDHHAQAASQRGDTNVPGVWIAGDLRPMTQQVAVAFGTGNIAAVMIDQWLRRRETAR